MLIELVEGFFVDPEAVAVVKATGKKQCAVFTDGQPATDGGFMLKHPAKRVVAEINAALEGEEIEERSEEEDDEDS